MEQTDEFLLKAIERKDEKAFSQFYEKYNRVILCFVLSKTHNKEVAKEIVQNFWVTFWGNPTIFRVDNGGCVKSFLLQHLRFRIYDVYRIAVPETILVEEAEVTSPITAGGDIEKEELIHIVHDALKNSSSLTKNAFWMRIDNMPAKEVAAELNVTTQTVHNKFSQSISIIRNYIHRHYPEIVENLKRNDKRNKLFAILLVVINFLNRQW